MSEEIPGIVSLTPGSTEVLCALGLADRLTGVDDDSDYPKEIRSLPRVGRGMDLDLERIIALKPNLVVAYLGSPGMGPLLARLEKRGVKCVGVGAQGLGGVMETVAEIGEAVARSDEAALLVARMTERMEKVAEVAAGVESRPKVYWEWWPKPLVTAGRTSWISDMIELAGGANVFSELDQESPAIDEDLVFARAPEVMIACWCGAERMPSAESIRARRGWDLVPAVREDRIYVVPEGLFERPGPRLMDGLDQLAKMLHPELFGG